MPSRLRTDPKHPERVCWGCDKCCSANDLRYGNGADQAQQPSEIFDHDWLPQGLIADLAAAASGTEGLPDRADGDASAVAEIPIRASLEPVRLGEGHGGVSR
jgi:Protein of unknown function (DUF3079)